MQEITRKKPAAGQTLRQLAQLYKGRWGQLICAVFWFLGISMIMAERKK